MFIEHKLKFITILFLLLHNANWVTAQADCQYWQNLQIKGIDNTVNSGGIGGIDITFPIANPYNGETIEWYVSEVPNFEIDDENTEYLGSSDLSLLPLSQNEHQPKILFVKDNPIPNKPIIDYMALWSGAGFFVSDLIIKNDQVVYLNEEELESEFLDFPITQREFIPKNTTVVLLFNDSLSQEEVMRDFESVDSCQLAFLKYNVSTTNFRTNSCTNIFSLIGEANKLMSRIVFNGDRLAYVNKRVILNTFPVRYVNTLPNFDLLLQELAIDKIETDEEEGIQKAIFIPTLNTETMYVKGVITGSGTKACCDLTSPEYLIEIELPNVIYPNPATKTIYLGIKIPNEYAYRIMSTDGMLHTQGRNAPVIKQLDVSFLGAGVYILEITDLVTKETLEHYFVRVRL